MRCEHEEEEEEGGGGLRTHSFLWGCLRVTGFVAFFVKRRKGLGLGEWWETERVGHLHAFKILDTRLLVVDDRRRVIHPDDAASDLLNRQRSRPRRIDVLAGHVLEAREEVTNKPGTEKQTGLRTSTGSSDTPTTSQICF